MAITNPYLQDQAQAITNTATQNLNNNILPGINSGAMAAGGYGGSRQGIAQGLAIGQTNQGITNSLASLYGNAYAQDQQLAAQKEMQAQQLAMQQQIAQMNDATSRLGLQNQYDLGLKNYGLGQTQAQNQYDLGLRSAGTSQYSAETARQLGLGQLDENRYQFDTNTDRAAFSDNFNRQLLGLQTQIGLLDSAMGWGNQALGWANQQQQQPIQDLTALTNIGTTIGGQGGTASTPYQGNQLLGLLGGANLGSSIFKSLFGG